MTEEEKQLLLADLCARLPYGVNVYCEWNYFQGERTNDSGILVDIDLYKKSILFKRSSDNYTYTSIPLNRIDGVVKPYLRPMSSITEEEKEEYDDLLMSVNDGCENTDYITYNCMEYVDWLNAHYFDYRGLIPKGIAIEAPEGMYN